ncbi:MAG: aspartyl/asparaginyl beta-hydroxylase domain-containing protein [Proteobacteria bacterium]|nr:aspartyl/asparaginyl beta-hydroxylase domain-containing protein [Pseudomonadota bacterium]
MKLFEPISLLEQVSQIYELPENVVQRLTHEILMAELPWKEAYSDYQSSGWKTASLLNASGHSRDVVISDCKAVGTEALKLMPATENLIRSLNLDIMWARVARLEPNSFIWEHRDFAELKKVPRLRLHIPLQTHPDSYLVLAGQRIFMKSGFIWKLNPTFPHGVCNRGPVTRLHLILDCYVNETLRRWLESERLDPSLTQKLPVTDVNPVLSKASALMNLGFNSCAESLLLKTFHSSLQDEGKSYDYIIKSYQDKRETGLAKQWMSKKQVFLNQGVRA